MLAVCFQKIVGHGTSNVNGRSKVPSQYYLRIWICNKLITEHNPLIPRILTGVADISRLYGHTSLRNVSVNLIVTMGCMGANKGLELNTVISQTLQRTRLDKLSWRPALKILDTPLSHMWLGGIGFTVDKVIFSFYTLTCELSYGLILWLVNYHLWQNSITHKH